MALDALAVGIQRKKVNRILDRGIRGCFASIDHVCLLKFLEHRIGDRGVLRLIGKRLEAGTIEDGRWMASEEGTP